MRRKFSFCAVILSAIVIIFNIAFVVKDSFFYSINNLPVGTFVRTQFNQELLLSQGYRLDVYQIEATKQFPPGVRVELCNDRTGEKRNVYWQTGIESTFISWNESDVYLVNINGVPIDLRGEGYDCRDYYKHTYVEPKE